MTDHTRMSDTAYQSVIASANALIAQKLDIIADLRAELAAVTAERDRAREDARIATVERNVLINDQRALSDRLFAARDELAQATEDLQSERSRAWLAGCEVSAARITKAAAHGIIDRALLHEVAAEIRALQPPAEFAAPVECAADTTQRTAYAHFDAWVAAQSEDVQELGLLEQIGLYSTEDTEAAPVEKP